MRQVQVTNRVWAAMRRMSAVDADAVRASLVRLEQGSGRVPNAKKLNGDAREATHGGMFQLKPSRSLRLYFVYRDGMVVVTDVSHRGDCTVARSER